MQGLRSLGSSALDFAFCAAGSVDVVEGSCLGMGEYEYCERACCLLSQATFLLLLLLRPLAGTQDVCAGIAILLEAGGIVTVSNPPHHSSSYWYSQPTPLPTASVGGRRFLAVRPCTVTQDETEVQARECVVKEIWKTTDEIDYKRVGVRYEIEQSGSS